MERLEKALYWAMIAAASGMTAWLGSAIIVWLVRQLTLE